MTKRYIPPIHYINGERFHWAFTSGHYIYLRRLSDDKLFRVWANEIKSHMTLEDTGEDHD